MRGFIRFLMSPITIVFGSLTALCIAGSIFLWLFGTAVEKTTGKQVLPDIVAPERKTDKDAANELLDKYRAYSMLTDMVGVKQPLLNDKIRIICTIIAIEKSGVSAGTVFEYQRELVTPDWGRRYTETPIPLGQRNFYVPRRGIKYIETIDPSISASDIKTSLELARDIRTNKKSCPPNWNALAIIRPVREKTVGNQKPDEIAAIENTMVEIKLPPDEKTEFRFFTMPSKPKESEKKK